MRSVLEAVCLRHSISILEQLDHEPSGLRYRDLKPFRVQGTKTDTLKRLVKNGLVLHKGKGEPYKISRKGQKALQYARQLKELDSG